MTSLTSTMELTPRAKRVTFVRCLATLVQWAQKQGLDLAFDEGMIETPRRVWDQLDSASVYADAKYPARSYHYLGLAVDLRLYRASEVITDLEHPTWHLIAERWESLHLLCVSGARRIAVGSNADLLCRAGIRHVSFGEGSKVYPLPWMR